MMPIYEYYCPQCQQGFEVMRAMDKRRYADCPKCGNKSKLVPSRFSWWFFNPFTVDGPGFSSKRVRNEELEEMNRECRER